MFLLSVIGSLVLSGYSIFGGRLVERNRGRSRLLHLLLVPPLVFAALWYVGVRQAGIITWIIVGDEGPLTALLEYPHVFAGVGASLVAAVVFARIALGWTDHRFALVDSLMALGLLSLGAYMAYRDFVEPIRGETAVEAAQNILADMIEARPIGKSTSPLTLREEYPERPWGYRKENRSFIAYRGLDPVIQIVVAPYEERWWQVAGTYRLDPPEDRLRKIEEAIESDPVAARRELERVLRSYPNADNLVRVREMKERIGLRLNDTLQ